LLEVLFEPKQTSKDNKDVDKPQVGDDRDDVEVHLLVRLEVLHVDARDVFSTRKVMGECTILLYAVQYLRVEARLGGGTCTEEIGIDGSKVAIGIQDDEGQETVEDNPRVCE
jgi:hypothetical protein